MKKLLVVLFLIVVPTFAADYKIVCVEKDYDNLITATNLTKKVKPYIKNGWVVNGAPFIMIAGTQYQYSAGMTHLCQCLVSKDQK